MAKQFGELSTADEVLEGIDLTGKRVLVTGISAGLGLETARALAAKGAKIVGTARDLPKADAALKGLSGLPSGSIEVAQMDLASLASVRACADELVTRGEAFDVVVANAGVMACPFGRTQDGFETQFGTNHLGHFVFVNRIASLIRSPGRLVVLSSSAHRASDVDLEDPGYERTEYDPITAYGRAKTANVLFAVEFDRRHAQRGVRATALHPGGIQTELLRHMTPDLFQALIQSSLQAEGNTGGSPGTIKTVPQGAATSVWASFVAPADEIGGRYCEDCQIAVVRPLPGKGGVRPYALDPDRAKALWDLSEQLVGERF